MKYTRSPLVRQAVHYRDSTQTGGGVPPAAPVGRLPLTPNQTLPTGQNAPAAPVEAPETIARFELSRGLPVGYLSGAPWRVIEVTHGGRPALRWPTAPGMRDKLKFLDGAEPRYALAGPGHSGAHLYGLPLALEVLADPSAALYVVNGESSVWQANHAGLAAICLGTGEGGGASLAPELAAALATIGRPVAVRVVYDADDTGRDSGPKIAAALVAAGMDAAALDLATWSGWGSSGPPPRSDVEDLVRLALVAGDSPAAVLADIATLPPPASALAATTRTVANREPDHRPGQQRHEWGAAALQGMVAEVAAATHGQRATTINTKSFRLGQLLVSPWAGLAEDDAIAAMMDASEACGYVAEHGRSQAIAIIRGGIRKGKQAGPRPEPAHAPDWKPGPTTEELDAIRHRAEVVAGHAFDDAKAAGSGTKQAESIARISAMLARLCVERGRPSVTASCRVVARDAGVDKGTVSRAMDRMRRIGWQIQVGGMDDDGGLTATAWTLPERPSTGKNDAMQRCVAGYEGRLTGNVEGILKDARCIAPFFPAGLLTRGMQRALKDSALASIGASGRRLVLVLAEHGELSIAQVAALTGLSPDTARKALGKMEARELVMSRAIPTKRRNSRAYLLTGATLSILQGIAPEDAPDAIAETLEAGGNVVARAQERIEADRARMDRAGKVAAVRGMSRRAALRLDRAKRPTVPGASVGRQPADQVRRRNDAPADSLPAHCHVTGESPCPAPASIAASVADTGAGLAARLEASEPPAPAPVLRWLDDAPPLPGLGQPLLIIGVDDPRPSWQQFEDECAIERDRQDAGRIPLPFVSSEPRASSMAAD
jgi:DNA-binding MarR family transcriptional regulator